MSWIGHNRECSKHTNRVSRGPKFRTIRVRCTELTANTVR